MRFYLGTHQVDWLRKTTVPLFLSRRRLERVKRLPRARGPWALDSGGFSELSMFGEWRLKSREYVYEVRRYMAEIGGMDWAAIMDWMCEPVIRELTRKTVAQHQALTIANFLELRALAPEVPWLPVLQGWTWGEYLDCLEAYDKAGVDLRTFPAVGLGTVCRRQQTMRAGFIVRDLAEHGIKLHAFGVKTTGLTEMGMEPHLASADSLAWSYDARRTDPLPGCSHKSCANCLQYGLMWRDQLLDRLAVTETPS